MVSERSESESASLKADRVGVFLDSASYFAAVREALFSARRQVVILGWDLHTRVELVRGGESGDDRPTRLGVPGEDAVHFRRKLGRYAFLLGGGVVLFYLLNWSWGYFVGEGELSEWLHALSERKGARSVLVAVFLLAGLVGAPLNVILAAAVLVFGPWTALFCGYAGSHLSAALVFPAGRRFGKPLLQRFAPAALQRLDRRLEERGIVPVAILRLVPVAPFVVVNAAAGATRLKGVDFHAGTFLGMLPGMFAVVWVTRAAEMAVTDPGITTFLVAAGLVLAVVLFFRWLRRQLPRSAGGKPEGRE